MAKVKGVKIANKSIKSDFHLMMAYNQGRNLGLKQSVTEQPTLRS